MIERVLVKQKKQNLFKRIKGRCDQKLERDKWGNQCPVECIITSMKMSLHFLCFLFFDFCMKLECLFWCVGVFWV